MADERHIENRFWLYLGALLADYREIRNGDDESHADIGHVTKMEILTKFRMADGRHFENSFRCLRHSCNELMLSSDFQ